MDDEPAILGVDPEDLIQKARSGDQESLHQLLFSAWLVKLLDDISGKTSRDYNVDSEAVRDYVFERVCLKIQRLKNPHNLPWCECVAGWCKKISERRALNLLRHRGVEEGHCDRVAHEYTINIRGRKRNTALYSSSISQEEEVEQKKRAALLVKMRRTVREVFRSLGPENAELISMWSSGKTLREMSVATDTPLSTVNNKLKKILKAFVEEIEKLVVNEIARTQAEEKRVRLLLGNLKECGNGLRQLIRNSVR